MSEKTLLWLLIAILVVVIVVKMCRNNNENLINYYSLDTCAKNNNLISQANQLNSYYKNNIPNIIKENSNTFTNINCSNIQQIMQQPVNDMITFAESTAESESQYNTALTNLQQSWKTASAECNNNECCKKLSPLFESDSNYKNIVNNYTTAFDNTQSCWYYGVNGCSNCHETNGNIVCDCSNNSGNITKTSLSESCISDPNNYVTNCNGELKCGSC